MEKLASSLQRKYKQMSRIGLHIETLNQFSPKAGYMIGGACIAAEKF